MCVQIYSIFKEKSILIVSNLQGVKIMFYILLFLLDYRHQSSFIIVNIVEDDHKYI